jgi:hypothetical protein
LDAMRTKYFVGERDADSLVVIGFQIAIQVKNKNRTKKKRNKTKKEKDK